MQLITLQARGHKDCLVAVLVVGHAWSCSAGSWRLLPHSLDLVLSQVCPVWSVTLVSGSRNRGGGWGGCPRDIVRSCHWWQALVTLPFSSLPGDSNTTSCGMCSLSSRDECMSCDGCSLWFHSICVHGSAWAACWKHQWLVVMALHSCAQCWSKEATGQTVNKIAFKQLFQTLQQLESL